MEVSKERFIEMYSKGTCNVPGSDKPYSTTIGGFNGTGDADDFISREVIGGVHGIIDYYTHVKKTSVCPNADGTFSVIVSWK